MDDATSRKRSRSNTPTPSFDRSKRHQHPDPASLIDIARAKELRDPSTRNAALNELLRRSSSHDVNFSLNGDATVQELARIAYDCLEWTDDDIVSDSTTPVFGSKEAWLQPPNALAQAWARHCETQLGPNRSLLQADALSTLQVILVILRNLSFVAANLRLLAYSPDILAVLMGCIYEDTSRRRGSTHEETNSSNTAPNPSLAQSALQTLVNLAPYLDISGQKMLADKLFYAPQRDGPIVPNADQFGQACGGNWGFGGLWLAKRLDSKDDSVADVSRDLLLQLTYHDYLVPVWSLFAALTHVLVSPTSPRPVLISAIEVLQELINHARVGVVGSVQVQDVPDEIPTIRAVLVNMPDAVLERLADLLYVPRLGPDSLDYVDPVTNVVTRVTTLKLKMGYDATVDTDVRDRALDVLVPLLELDSPRMASRLGVDVTKGRPRYGLFDMLVSIVTTRVGRNEASMLATQLLRELSRAEENETALQMIQERLVELASRSSRVASLVFNHLYVPAATKDSDEEDEPDEEEHDTLDSAKETVVA